MKKLFLFFTLLAGIVAMTGCKKDQDVVTLKAVIDPDTKAYFGQAVRPYWDGDDKVRVIGGGYSVPLDCNLSGVSETYATILSVQNSTNNYYAAIFPTEAAEKMFIPETNGTASAVIYFRPDQIYHWDETNQRQRVNMIMGAVTNNSTKTFHFKNLCSILRLHVTNDFDYTIKISRVTIQATGAYVAGSANVTLTQGGTPEVRMDGLGDGHDNVLSLYPESNNGFIKSIEPDGDDYIDVVVPPFDASSLNIELELYKEVVDAVTNDVNDVFIGNSDAIITDPPALPINTIVTINLTTDHNFQVADYAYLEPGPDFYYDMHNTTNGLLRQLQSGEKVINIKFNCVQDESHIPTTAVNVKAEHSAYNIWAYLIDVDNREGCKSIQVDCVVPLIYADKDCSHMFEDLVDLETMQWTNNATSGFQTEDVVDMSYMFAGCEKLTNLSGPNFNTTNVRTMAHMFEGCASFSNGGNLGISNFNTHNLQDMEAMFKGCSSLQDLDLSSFSTNRVANMKELFSGCRKLFTHLYLDNFVISDGTIITDMCNDLCGAQWGILPIYCDSGVEQKMSSSVTGLNTNYVTFHRPPHPTAK